MTVITRQELNRATLARQLLLERAPLDVPTAVRALGGIQAQEPKPPFIGLWSRLEDFTREDLVAALTSKAVVRATLMRATLHLATAEDYLAWRGPLDPVLRGALVAIRGRDEGLDIDATVAAARKLIARTPRPFDEIREHLTEQFPGVNDRALGYATRMCLPLAMVPTQDTWGFPRVSSFTPAELWLKARLGPGDLGALVRAYLRAFGPASVTDMQKWSGMKGLKPAFAELREELVTFKDERKRELFDLPDAPRPGADGEAPVRLLPEFDNLVLAHDDRSRVVPDEHKGKIVTKNLRVRAVFLVDGIAAGTWTHDAKKGVVLEPFGKLPASARKQLVAEGERLSGFVSP